MIFFRLIIFILFILNSSCSNKLEDPGYPYQIEVLNLIPNSSFDNGPPSFEISPKTFKYLRKLNELDGDYLKVLFGVKLKIESIDGSLVKLKSQSSSTSPNLRYRIKNGIIIPRDYNTLMTFSAYYLFETLLNELESYTGIQKEEFSSWSGKMNVLYEPSTEFESDSVNISSVSKFNAAYEPESKSFLLFQRSRIEEVPLAGNLQVLAHEFGHAIFDYVFYRPSHEQDDFFYNLYTLHGINEGFADFISFVITSSTDILRSSINIDQISNQRDFKNSNFLYSNISELCTLGFYCTGTVFAKSLFSTMGLLKLDTQSKEDRFKMSKKIIGALSTTLNSMKSEFAKFNLKKRNSYLINDNHEDGWLGLFLRSFLKGIENIQERQAICKQFSILFTEKGFAAPFKEGVCPL